MSSLECLNDNDYSKTLTFNVFQIKHGLNTFPNLMHSFYYFFLCLMLFRWEAIKLCFSIRQTDRPTIEALNSILQNPSEVEYRDKQQVKDVILLSYFHTLIQ